MRNTPPDPDQVEVTLFGPGYGECVVVHLGENRWIVIDSCIDTTTGNPAVLEYFKTIGVSAQEAIKLIIISHWHDDHIKGLSRVIESCPDTPVCCSLAMTKEEFIANVLDYDNLFTRATTSGVSEIKETLRILRDNKRSIKKALANRTILRLRAQGASEPCVITSLSPSDSEMEIFLNDIANMIPELKKTKKRVPSLSPNNTAVALWIEIGSARILLGSDLEEMGKPSTGWSAIVHSEDRPQGQASIFKIPHHGSQTGHHDQVWEEMIDKSRIAILSPWYLGGNILPTTRDIERIISFASDSYITTYKLPPKSKKTRPSAVERTIRETVGKIKVVEPSMGWVSLRNGGKDSPDKWGVELSHVGIKLSDLAISA